MKAVLLVLFVVGVGILVRFLWGKAVEGWRADYAAKRYEEDLEVSEKKQEAVSREVKKLKKTVLTEKPKKLSELNLDEIRKKGL